MSAGLSLPRIIHKLSKINKVFLILITVISLISVILPRDDYKTLMLFLMLIPLFIVYKFDAGILIAYVIVLFAIAGLAALLNERDISGRLSMTTFWLLSVGVICILIQLWTNKLNK